ncbi:MAG: hypothetical protein ACSW8H_02975, partial [bacterium]
MQKEHHRFRPLSRPENKKSGFRTAGLPSESPKMPVFARFLPEMLKETPFVVVDKRRFFYGGEIGIRTLGTQDLSTIDFESTAFDHSAIS